MNYTHLTKLATTMPLVPSPPDEMQRLAKLMRETTRAVFSNPAEMGKIVKNTVVPSIGAGARFGGPVGGIIGGLKAPSGHFLEGTTRGAIQGAGAGAGMQTGMLISRLLAGLGPKGKLLQLLSGPLGKILIGGAGLVTGNAATRGTLNTLVGKPSWLRDK